MKFFAYSPSVEAYIRLENGKVIDVSSDIISGSVRREIDAPSTFTLTLANKSKKYDGIIQPMDKIVIFLTKTKRIQVFSGYVDDAPLLSMWTKNATISGTCTLKRLTNLFWDEGTFFSQQISKANGETAEEMWKAAVRVLKEIAHWPEDAIYVSKLPDKFLRWSQKLFKEQMDDDLNKAIVEKWHQLLGANAFVGSNAGSGAGMPGTVPEQYKAAVESAAAKYDLEPAIIAALCRNESNWNPTAIGTNPTSRDYGMMQINDKSWRNTFKNFFPPSTRWQDPVANIDAGARIFSSAVKSEGGDYYKALRHYNGGPRWASKPTTDTYAKKVMGYYQEYKAAVSGGSSMTSNGEVASTSPTSSVERTEPSGGGSSGNTKCGLYIAPAWPVKSGQAGSKGPGMNGLQEAFSNALQAMIRDAAAAGHKITAADGGNGWRSYETQVSLKAKKPTLAATPGRSNHGWGLAQDLSYSSGEARQWAHANCSRYGLRFPMDYEPWHIEPPIEKKSGITSVMYDGKAVTVGGGTGSTLTDEPSALSQAFWAIYDAPIDNAESVLFTGNKAIINDVPVWGKVRELFNASMRSVMSAPDGSIVAWFPDKFGIYARTPYFIIEDIEIIDINISRNDAPLTTHVFASGSSGPGENPSIEDWGLSNGVVSIEPGVVSRASIPKEDGSSETDSGKSKKRKQAGDSPILKEPSTLMKGLVNIPEGQEYKYSPEYIFKRYGARPLKVEGGSSFKLNSIMPFLMALWTFMEKWSQQYRTNAEFTFMPELFPGGRVRFASWDLEMYVESVTHNFDYEGGGFTTSATLSCPTSKNRKGFVSSQVPEFDDEGSVIDGHV